jgi:hypothetical protein
MCRKNIKRPLTQRIIALGVAYAVALSALVSSFVAAQAAAEAAIQPAAVICHSIAVGEAAPASSPDGTSGKLCAEGCCIGCLMFTAALPPPPANAAPLSRTISHRLMPVGAAELSGGPQTKSHRSRAPPIGT